MTMSEPVGTVIALLVVLAIGFGLLVCGSYVWAAVTGRRTEGMDEEYDSRPCPTCGYDLRAGHDRCPECGRPTSDSADDDPRSAAEAFDLARLRDEWPHDPIEPVPPEPWDPLVQVYSTMDGWMADLLVDQLTARGVWCTLQHKRQEELAGGMVSAVEFHRVVVAESDRQRADSILDRFRARGTMAADDGG